MFGASSEVASVTEFGFYRSEYRGPKTAHQGQRSNFRGCLHEVTLHFVLLGPTQIILEAQDSYGATP